MDQFDVTNILKEKPYFCVAPWVHQYVGPVGDVKPCCVYQHDKNLGNLKCDSLKKIWNNDTTKKLRMDLLNGVKREECSWCNDRERPFKDNFNKLYFSDRPDLQEIVKNTLPDGTVPEHQMYYLDIRFSNLCNFKCRTCGPHFSTSIATEEKELYPNKFMPTMHYPGTTEDQVFNEIVPHLPNIIEAYFAGGEPMMQKQHYQTLEKLIEIGNTDISIRYNTNFSKLKLGKWNVLEYWKHFKQVIVMASIDARYERGEYWRKGTVWEETLENRKMMIRECPNVQFILASTISWVNALDWVDMHKQWVMEGLLKVDDIMVNESVTPPWFCMKNIPDWKKEQIEKKFKTHIMWLKSQGADEQTIFKVQSAINFMYSDIKKIEFPFEDFHRMIKQFDVHRNERFFDVFPEHVDMKEYIEANGFKFDY